MDKDVAAIVTVPADEIDGFRLKGDKTAIAADAGSVAVVICLPYAVID